MSNFYQFIVVATLTGEHTGYEYKGNSYPNMLSSINLMQFY